MKPLIAAGALADDERVRRAIGHVGKPAAAQRLRAVHHLVVAQEADKERIALADCAGLVRADERISAGGPVALRRGRVIGATPLLALRALVLIGRRGAEQHRQELLDRPARRVVVLRRVPVLIELVAFQERLLLDVRQNSRDPGVLPHAAGRVGNLVVRGREHAERVVMVVQGQAELLEVVGALHPAGRLARRLHRGQQQRDQDADDRDHHQQLDQRKRRPPRVRAVSHVRSKTHRSWLLGYREGRLTASV